MPIDAYYMKTRLSGQRRKAAGEGTGLVGGGRVSSHFLSSRLFKVPYFSMKQVIAKKCKVVSGKQKKTLELLHNLICACYRPDPRGRDFEAPDLERGIIFRTHESSSLVSSHLKLFKDRLLLKIRFSALTSKLL